MAAKCESTQCHGAVQLKMGTVVKRGAGDGVNNHIKADIKNQSGGSLGREEWVVNWGPGGQE